jgi:hypothetical protein
MAVHKPIPPIHVMQEYKAGLADFIPPNDDLGRVFLDAHAGWHAAHEVFSLGLQHIGDDGSGIEKARSVGWRFLAADENSDLAGACHVRESVKGIHGKFAGLSRASKLVNVFEFIRQFEALEDVHERAKAPEVYDLVVLRIPGLVEAFWLKSNDPANDLVVPFYTSLKGVRDWDLAPYSKQPSLKSGLKMVDFLKLIRTHPIARRRLNFKDKEGSEVPQIAQQLRYNAGPKLKRDRARPAAKRKRKRPGT